MYRVCFESLCHGWVIISRIKRICVLITFSGGVFLFADGSSVTVGILVAFLCLLCVGIIACIKRKTLLSLFFSNNKNTIEKLGYEPALPHKTFESLNTDVIMKIIIGVFSVILPMSRLLIK